MPARPPEAGRGSRYQHYPADLECAAFSAARPPGLPEPAVSAPQTRESNERSRRYRSLRAQEKRAATFAAAFSILLIIAASATLFIIPTRFKWNPALLA